MLLQCKSERKLQLMIEQKEHFHGSDLEKIEKIYGIKKENIVSFAANVNPLGESGKLKTALSERLMQSQNTLTGSILLSERLSAATASAITIT